MLSKTIGMKIRSTPRRKTRVLGTVKYYSQAAQGRIVDLSATGMALDITGPFHAANGSTVKIESDELGVLEGTVKWRRSGRLGIQFRPNSNASAQVSSYFRFFHKDVKTTLTRER
ncbi:PilZ domain-containing protein [Rhizobium puerariae]|uniref:PilZ domain-containing protein n=1 Tax=Rhizobium puerariae TaxID=1585791 RepID=A0ABV6ANN1_9HYPH